MNNNHNSSIPHIRKKNELVLSKKTKILSITESKILYASLLKLQKNRLEYSLENLLTDESRTVSFSKEEFTKLFDVDIKLQSTELKKHVENIMQISYFVETEEQESFVKISLFEKAAYMRGIFSLTFTSSALPYLKKFDDKYITVLLPTISKFKSGYTVELYEFLKAKYGYKQIYMSKEEILAFFNLQKTKSYLSNSSLFEKKVLNVAINEINAHTGFKLSLERDKRGRKTIGYTLNILTREDAKTLISDEQILMIKQMITYIMLHDFYVNLSQDEKNNINYIRTLKNLNEISSKQANNLIEKFKEIENKLKIEEAKAKQIYNNIEFINWLDGEE